MARQITDLDEIFSNELSNEDLLLIRDISSRLDKKVTFEAVKAALGIANFLNKPDSDGKFVVAKDENGVSFDKYEAPEFRLLRTVDLSGLGNTYFDMTEFYNNYAAVKFVYAGRHVIADDNKHLRWGTTGTGAMINTKGIIMDSGLTVDVRDTTNLAVPSSRYSFSGWLLMTLGSFFAQDIPVEYFGSGTSRSTRSGGGSFRAGQIQNNRLYFGLTGFTGASEGTTFASGSYIEVFVKDKR